MTGSPLWRPTASMETLRRRAAMLGEIRAFFSAREILEVETPALVGSASAEPNLQALSLPYDGPAAPASGLLWLHTSPEFAMKRLLAAGSGSIYQICHVFRADERGRLHNPEFTLLEWYRPGFDQYRLMDEVVALVGLFLPPRPVERVTYRDVFADYLGVDPFLTPVSGLRDCARAQNIPLPDLSADDRDGWLDLLLSMAITPRLGRECFTFLCDFPASQAALARLRREEGVELAERFELFIDGIEIANGYHELTDPEEQHERFLAEQARREAAGLPPSGRDERLLAALEHGLPDCAGVALGLDRLVMLATGKTRLDEVLSFPVERC